jgi:hypothetical protein
MLSVCLSFKHPELNISESFIMRFFGEKTFGIQLHMSCFSFNSKGFPLLSKQHAQICKEFMKI